MKTIYISNSLITPLIVLAGSLIILNAWIQNAHLTNKNYLI